MSTPRKPLGEAEFNQLFHTYHKPVFLYLRTLLARRGHPPDPHLVEDLTQEAFTILWEKQESFLASPNPIGWAVRHCCQFGPEPPAHPTAVGRPAGPGGAGNPGKPPPPPPPGRNPAGTGGRGGARGAGPAPPGLPGGVQLPGAGPGTGDQAKHLGLPGEPDQSQVPKKFPGFGTFFAGWMQGIPSPRT